MPSPYLTQESAADLWFEQVNNAAVIIGCMAYGTLRNAVCL